MRDNWDWIYRLADREEEEQLKNKCLEEKREENLYVWDWRREWSYTFKNEMEEVWRKEKEKICEKKKTDCVKY